MSWVRIWVHLVFSTKNRFPYFNSQNREIVFRHMINNMGNKGIQLESLGGYTDHVHCLLSLGNDQSISKVAQLIKGESSFWINKEDITDTKFSWQDDYWAVGVSESHVKKVCDYILAQEEHHRTKSFAEEVELFMKKYNWEYTGG